MNGRAERVLARLTRGRSVDSLVAKMVPNYYQYAPNTIRSTELYGYHWDGLDISDSIQWYLYFGFLDPSHEALLALCRPGDTVLDVGANIGVTALRMARSVGPEGRVYAFEPDPANHARFEALCRVNAVRNVEPLPLAASNRSGEVLLEVRDRHNLGMNQVGATGRPVAAITLDEFVEQRKVSEVGVLKIDVEGFECSVLEGARHLIERYRPRLFVEFDDAALISQGRSGAELLRLLEDAGYSMFNPAGNRVEPSRSPSNVHFDLTCTPRRH